ncbi:MAG: UvrD-helicase domain-containing protein, partial [Aeromicrobium sp.]
MSQERVRFARAVRLEVGRRKQLRGLLSYDDTLVRLNDALDDPASPARGRMRARWSVVLVDEFQDTNPVQWEVLARAFGDGSTTMVLIGDHKQAIYAFRGGDIDSYLAAVSSAGERRTLGTNYRSDRPLVQALQVLTRRARLGHDSIEVVPVTASREHTRLAGAPSTDPVRVRVIDLGADEQPSIGTVRDLVAADLADEVARLLTSGATYD